MAITVGFIRAIGIETTGVFVPDFEIGLEEKFDIKSRLEERFSIIAKLEEKFNISSWLEKGLTILAKLEEKFNLKGRIDK